MDVRIALFIDFENIASGVGSQGVELPAVIEFLKEKGKIFIRRAYGNWAQYEQYRGDLLYQGIDLIQLYSYGFASKNRADIRLAVDAMEVLFTHQDINTFALISGDQDFSPLVVKLREHSKYVIGIGPAKSSSELLVNNCDEFIFYESLVTIPQPSAIPQPPTRPQPVISLDREDARDLLSRALRVLEDRVREKSPFFASEVKQVMLELESSFNERSYGYRQFKNFLEDNKDMAKLSYTDESNLIVLPFPKEVAEAPVIEEPLYVQYKRILKKTGVQAIALKVEDRINIMRDLYHLIKERGGEITLKQAIDILKEGYEAKNLPWSKKMISSITHLAFWGRCFNFPDTPSFAMPVFLQEVDFNEFVERCDINCLLKLVEHDANIDIKQVSLTLFETEEKAENVQNLLSSMTESGLLLAKEGQFFPKYEFSESQNSFPVE